MSSPDPLRTVAASLHGLDIVGAGAVLRVTGTCRRDGAGDASPGELDVDLLLIGPGDAVVLRARTTPCLRFEDGAPRWTGFTADLPLADLPAGRTTVHVEVGNAQTGVVRRATAAAVGLIASSRPVVSGGRRLQAMPAHGQKRVELVVQHLPAPLASVRWGATLMRRDLGALVRRRPFAWARPARFLTRPLRRQPIWLVGERPGTARDNGYHLFAHLRRDRPDIRAYYVIERDSDQYDRVATLGRVVVHSSWRHRWLMLHARVLANAYSVKHMVPRQWDPRAYMRDLAWRVGAYRVYLKHGVNVNTTALRRRVGGYDLYLTSSDAETAACRATSGYDHQVVQTGLPRYDALVPTPPSRTILFMPTWRLYLAAKLFSDGDTGTVPFDGSAYEQFVTGLLSSTRLHDLLTRHDYRLQLMPHFNLREHLVDLTVASDRVTVLDGAAADIQDVIRACDLFVTDHSSVHFDLAYLGTPVVYAHFDADDYATGHAEPSWFDHERDGFGPVTADLASTLDAVEHYLGSGCRREDVYTQRAGRAFAHHDTDNSRRTVEAIEHLVRTGGNN